MAKKSSSLASRVTFIELHCVSPLLLVVVVVVVVVVVGVVVVVVVVNDVPINKRKAENAARVSASWRGERIISL